MSKKNLLILMATFVIFVLFFINKQTEDKSQNKVVLKEKSTPESYMNRLSNKKENLRKKIRQLATGSVKYKFSKNKSRVLFLKNLPRIDNQFLRNKKIKLIEGVFASLQVFPNKRLISKYQDYYIYERTDEMKNVFVSEEGSRIKIWSGDIVLTGNLLPDSLYKNSNIEIVKKFDEFTIVRLLNNNQLFEDLNELSELENLKSIELDLNSQRRQRI